MKYFDPKTRKPATAKHFYELVKDNKVNAENIAVKKDGTTGQKLQVIRELKSLLTADVRVIDGYVMFYNFSFEKRLRSKRQIFALSLVEERNINGQNNLEYHIQIHSSDEKVALEIAYGKDKLKTKQLAEALEKSPQYARKILKNLEDKKLLEKVAKSERDPNLHYVLSRGEDVEQ